MGWFESQASKEKKSAVKNIVAVMLADGKITPQEQQFLSMVCKRVGVSDKELKEILKKPQNVKFIPAKSERDRLFQLMDVVYMMIVDGTIDRREMALCVTIATQLGFRPLSVVDIVNNIVAKIKQGKDRRQVSVDVEAFLEK
ncbi:MAG: TerB family tellurite resistance protein [Thermodesulfobacteriota bacterium]|nr:TerB family tellurite resistance protein [Thermodesulfobacteriota bacterium]